MVSAVVEANGAVSLASVGNTTLPAESMVVVEGFKTVAECKAAGDQAVKLATNVRDGKYVCVQRTK